ncbi:MAG: DNA-protecting protein DprA [Lachnospiraceae bacterium]|nr:DNA-protecting protein DprA [Lachnospiraceae bacterium]
MESRMIIPLERAYPDCLKMLRNPPGQLYVRGRLPDPEKPAVAIVGARNCTFYGSDMAKWFAFELAKAGVQIISGMAMGVDGIAQRAALDAGGRSFALLGCGADICYPKSNRDLYERLLISGGVISEYPDGMQPISRLFPSRNRLIAGFSRAVIVVEAREKSGTLITADAALEQGKDVFVLPGRITDALSAGCNRLLAQGAGIALSPQMILEALHIAPKQKHPAADIPSRIDESVLKCLTDDELSIWKKLSDRPLSLQELYDKAMENGEKCTLPNVLAIVMTLVEKSVIRTDGDGRYYI